MVSKVMGSILGGGEAERAGSAITSGQAAAQAALTANANKAAGLSDTFMTNANNLTAASKPLVDLTGQVASDAKNYDSQENQDLAAGMASADVNQSFAKSNGMLERQLTRSGANPNSGAAIASLRDAQIQRAGMEAGAMTGARRLTKDKAIGLRSAAVGTGLNVANTGATAGNQALSALGTSGNLHNAAAGVEGNINAQNLAVTTSRNAASAQNNELGSAGLNMLAQGAGAVMAPGGTVAKGLTAIGTKK